MTALVGYLRGSSSGELENSLAGQREGISVFAERLGHEIVGFHCDEHLSGALSMHERPGLFDALLDVREGRAAGIVVHRVDRLARSLTVQEATFSAVWEHGGAIFEAVSCSEILRDDPDDPMRKAMRQMAGVFAELEREIGNARRRGGRRRKLAAGGWVGGHRLHRRFGYRVVDSEYVPEPAEQEVIDRMRELRASSTSYRGVAAALTAEGHKAPEAGVWYAATIRRILQNTSKGVT